MAPDPSELTERQACLVLNALPGLGPLSLQRLLAVFDGDARALLAADPSRLRAVDGVRSAGLESLREWRAHFDPRREEERMARSGITFILRGDPEYPALLREIHDPPLGLYSRGRPLGDRLCIAVVGCRKATLYGLSVARKLASELVRMGFCVVSGMARGVDTAAHEGAMEGGGATAAVMGTGMDLIYPPENLGLYRRLGEVGTVLSEFPFGRPADRQSFPMRNRIISGMCTAVIVVESDEQGGAMITAQLAGEQGRPVFAVPGRIDQPSSAGCNRLIRDGATLLTGAEDVLTELPYLAARVPAAPGGSGSGGGSPGRGGSAGRGGSGGGGGSESGGESGPDRAGTRGGGRDGPGGRGPADAGAAALLACFGGGGILGPDALAAASGLSAPAVAAALTVLEIGGRIRRRPDGAYEAVPGGQ